MNGFLVHECEPIIFKTQGVSKDLPFVFLDDLYKSIYSFSVIINELEDLLDYNRHNKNSRLLLVYIRKNIY